MAAALRAAACVWWAATRRRDTVSPRDTAVIARATAYADPELRSLDSINLATAEHLLTVRASRCKPSWRTTSACSRGPRSGPRGCGVRRDLTASRRN